MLEKYNLGFSRLLKTIMPSLSTGLGRIVRFHDEFNLHKKFSYLFTITVSAILAAMMVLKLFLNTSFMAFWCELQMKRAREKRFCLFIIVYHRSQLKFRKKNVHLNVVKHPMAIRFGCVARYVN